MKFETLQRGGWLLLIALLLNLYLDGACPFIQPKELSFSETALEQLISQVQNELLAAEEQLPHCNGSCGSKSRVSYANVEQCWDQTYHELSSLSPLDFQPVELLLVAQDAYLKAHAYANKGKHQKSFQAFMQAFLSLDCLQNALQTSTDGSKDKLNTVANESCCQLKKFDLFNQLGAFYNDFDTNPYFSKAERKALTPYILPYDHPVKEALDYLCKSERVSATKESLAAAGFMAKDTQPRSYITVASHFLMPGYLVKVYTDDEFRLKAATPGWKWFQRRIEGAEKIRQIIDSHKLTKFCVPFKWIYPLPPKPNPPEYLKEGRKNEILVVEDMCLTSSENNFKAWYHKITEAHLREFFIIVSFAGGSSYWPRNVAYTKKGLFAFIDTEYPYKAADYSTIDKHLSPQMRAYWKRLSGRE